MENPSILPLEKQIELMFLDAVAVISDRKKTIFDLTRWIVTLQGLIIGFVALRGIDVGQIFIAAPLMIGTIGFLLNIALSRELAEHRHTLAKIRNQVGGPFAEMNKDFISKHLYGGTPSRTDYWSRITSLHRLIIAGSTCVSIYCAWTILY